MIPSHRFDRVDTAHDDIASHTYDVVLFRPKVPLQQHYNPAEPSKAFHMTIQVIQDRNQHI